MRTPIAIDTETCATIGVKGLAAPPLVCLTWATEKQSGILHATDLSACLTKDLLEDHPDKDAILVGANIAYDVGVLSNEYPDLLPWFFDLYDNGRIEDVQINQKLIDISLGRYPWKPGYSLAEIAKRHFGTVMDKDTWRMRYHELIDTPIEDWPQGAIDYAVGDAVVTRDLWIAQQEYAEKKGIAETLRDAKFQAGPAFALWLMSARGIRTNGPAVAALKKNILEEQATVRKLLKDNKLLRKDDTRDTKVAKAKMQEVMGDKAKRTKKSQKFPQGQISLDKEACKDSGNKVLKAYGKYTELAHTLANYIVALEKGTMWPLQTYFNTLLETGRTSSSRPNIQNQPRKPGVRECFIPRPGYVFIACDFSNAEMHTFAQVCLTVLGHSRLADTLNAGMDAHTFFAAALMGSDYKSVAPKVKIKDSSEKAFRQRAKAANFGYPGGLGAEKFIQLAKGYDVILTLDESKALKEYWLDTYPEAREYFKWVNNDLRSGDWFYARHFATGRLQGRIGYCNACNCHFQGLAADAAKAALFAVAMECYIGSGALAGCYPVNFPHDEIIVECPDHPDKMDAAAKQLSTLMADVFNQYVPDVPTTAEPAIARVWSKDMEPVFDSQGRLTVWEAA